MMPAREQRCAHGFLRSRVPCPTCDTGSWQVERPKLIARAPEPPTVIDRPYVDHTPASLPAEAPVPVAARQPRKRELVPVPAAVRRARATGLDRVPNASHAEALNPERVLAFGAAAHFLAPADLTGRDRHQSVTEARMLTMWLVRRATRLSYPQIGALFGRRDNSTAVAAISGIEDRRQVDSDLRAHLDELLARALEECRD